MDAKLEITYLDDNTGHERTITLNTITCSEEFYNDVNAVLKDKPVTCRLALR